MLDAPKTEGQPLESRAADAAPHANEWRRVLVPVDLGAATPARLRAALSLAQLFDADLIGVAAEDLLFAAAAEGVGVTPDLIELERDRIETELGAAGRIFREIVGERPGAEWRCAVSGSHAYVAEQARTADIVVASRRGSHDPEPGTMGVDPGDLVLRLGVPLLVMPPANGEIRIGTALVAWKNTREARRALRDALPLLRRADGVLITSVGAELEDPSLPDLQVYFRRHGIDSRVHHGAHPVQTVGTEILDLAGRESVGLIVAGAYGHSRLTEWFFGGVTRDLLRASPVPLFVSH